MSTPGAFVEFGRQGGLAGDGRCKAFAEGADGTGWGEGVGVLLVERLSDARAVGASGVGGGAGFGGESGWCVERVDGAEWSVAAAGDPGGVGCVRVCLRWMWMWWRRMVRGRGWVIRSRRRRCWRRMVRVATGGRPLWLGSVKSNVGHTQAAAGVAGVIKMVQAMRHGVLPATLHVDEPSSHVDWSAGAVELLTEARPWPRRMGGRGGRGCRRSVCRGTNAHVILEQAPAELE